MGQHKFEEQLCRELRNREVSPSPEAWQKLNARLEKKGKSRSYFWVAGIAASLVSGFLILSIGSNNDLEETPVVVETPVESVKKENEENALEVKEERRERVNSNMEQIVSEEVKEPEVEKVEKLIPSPVVTEVAEQQVASVVEVLEVPEELKMEVYTNEPREILPKRLEEVIAEVSSEINASGDMTEAEVDALLYKAAAEISLQRDRERFSGKVDATALLRDVEIELDQSFREKVFDILKDGYLKARTAVANRNF